MKSNRMNRSAASTGFLTVICLASVGAQAAPLWVTYEGKDGPGKGKHIVLISGDEEYRSEEALPQLGKILAGHFGFTCTVLFAIDPKDGTINPEVTDNIPGLAALRSADLMIIATRFRNPPDDQMKQVVDYVESGRPIMGLRTATHAFKFDQDKTYARYSWDSTIEGWEGGFGRRILGETWIAHHGEHAHQSTRGKVVPGMEKHPIMQGCDDIWGPTDVYKVRLPLPGDSKPVVLGQVLKGMKSTDGPVEGAQNDPMMPVAWIRTYSGSGGKSARVFTTTMGAATDLPSAGVRRMLVNAAFWCMGMSDRLPAKPDVGLVGRYEPTPFGFKGYRKGVKPSDHAMDH